MKIPIEQEFHCDVLVIGTEGTGARAALEAARLGTDVLAVTKGFLARSGATLTADGEIDVDSRSAKEIFGVNGSMDDSPEQFAIDMIKGGDYLPNQQLVAIHTEEAPRRVKELVDWGAKLEGFIHAPGHTYPRGLWIPGIKIVRLFARRMSNSGVSILENTLVIELLHDTDGVLGAVALHIPTGQLFLIRSRAIVMATGGAMRIFPLTTAPNELTGDGMAMALRCGASLMDMEFPMFLPYCFISPPALEGVIFSYNASALLEGHALNRHGERYMKKWDPLRLEKTTRDINAVASAMEIRDGKSSMAGGTYLSFKHLPKNLLDFSSSWFPGNLRGLKAAGFNLRDFFPNPYEDAWEVAPACHFWNGGIRIDEQCATGIPGLFAAGEGTAGLHGANRLAGNALTMTQVWGARAGYYAARYSKNTALRKPPKDQMDAIREKFGVLLEPGGSGPSVIEMRQEIKHLAGDCVGIVRDDSSLNQTLDAIASLREQLPLQQVTSSTNIFNHECTEGLQNENMLDVLEAVVRSSLMRKESRGAMYRVDYPTTHDDRFLCNMVVRRTNGKWSIEEMPVEERYLTFPKGSRVYGRERDYKNGNK